MYLTRLTQCPGVKSSIAKSKVFVYQVSIYKSCSALIYVKFSYVYRANHNIYLKKRNFDPIFLIKIN